MSVSGVLYSDAVRRSGIKNKTVHLMGPDRLLHRKGAGIRVSCCAGALI